MSKIDTFPIKRRQVANLVDRAYHAGFFAPHSSSEADGADEATLRHQQISYVESITDKIIEVVDLKRLERPTDKETKWLQI